MDCLYRGVECRVTSWSAGPVPWPVVQPIGQRGGCGLLVNEELARAICTESAEALQRWLGASHGVVWRWRVAFGVSGNTGTQGSKAAHRTASRAGAASVRERAWTDAERAARAARAATLDLTRFHAARWPADRGGWTTEQIALLGTDTDERVAARLGRSVHAVRVKRGRLKIAAAPSAPAASNRTGLVPVGKLG